MSDIRAALRKAPKDGVIVRRAPHDGAGVAGKLHQGDVVRYDPQSADNGFVKVRTANITGWLPLKGVTLEAL